MVHVHFVVKIAVKFGYGDFLVGQVGVLFDATVRFQPCVSRIVVFVVFNGHRKLGALVFIVKLFDEARSRCYDRVAIEQRARANKLLVVKEIRFFSIFFVEIFCLSL